VAFKFEFSECRLISVAKTKRAGFDEMCTFISFKMRWGAGRRDGNE
jgi:hypothetical protein